MSLFQVCFIRACFTGVLCLRIYFSSVIYPLFIQYFNINFIYSASFFSFFFSFSLDTRFSFGNKKVIIPNFSYFGKAVSCSFFFAEKVLGVWTSGKRTCSPFYFPFPFFRRLLLVVYLKRKKVASAKIERWVVIRIWFKRDG